MQKQNIGNASLPSVRIISYSSGFTHIKCRHIAVWSISIEKMAISLIVDDEKYPFIMHSDIYIIQIMD